MGSTEFFNSNISIFCCPKCQGDLTFQDNKFSCKACALHFGLQNTIPMLFYKNEIQDSKNMVTDEVKSFYEETPFPNYDNLNDSKNLIERLNKGLFERILDDSIPLWMKIIECGCGTGQLTNFLAVKGRSAIGTDFCMNSLKLGQEFKEKANLATANFIQMNLFHPCFKKEEFDLVISKGVLHHTGDPVFAFRTIAKLVKPGGHILIGLYHKYGRVITNIRQMIFRATKDRFLFLDPNLRDKDLSMLKKKTWLHDQYKHPRESSHTCEEVLDWLEESGFTFVRSYPRFKPINFSPVCKDIFLPDSSVNSASRFMSEFMMISKGSKSGGFFVVIAKKR